MIRFRNHSVRSIAVMLLMVATTLRVSSQQSNELRIDPLLLVSLKECRNISANLADKLFTGWEFRRTAVLLYKPNVQELLINYPHKPQGFSLYQGFNPLGDDTMYVRNDTTTISFDDQNTSKDIEDITVLVVADPDSRMRNSLRGTFFNHPKDVVGRWLDQWNFLQSPYDEIQLILHEGFHVYQHVKAPDKGANETVVMQYPLLDPMNNALYVLEGNILKDALLTEDSGLRLNKIREFVAVRHFRQSRLDSNWVEYENLNEYNEGLAKYVEYKFLRFGENVEPITEMYYHQGFNGYRAVLAQRFRDAMTNMVNVVAVNDDRFGNRFGSGPLRFKLYELGACQALLLDYVMPTWKARIFADGVYLSELLNDAVGLSADDLRRYLEKAKFEYMYDESYQSKLQFEEEGKKKIQEKVAAIYQTEHTLVEVSYEGFVEKVRLGGFTPFGITQVSKRTTIFDLIPMTVLFKDGVELHLKIVTPVLVDRDKRLIAFAVSTPASKLTAGDGAKLDVDEFTLSTSKMEIKQSGNKVRIQLLN